MSIPYIALSRHIKQRCLGALQVWKTLSPDEKSKHCFGDEFDNKYVFWLASKIDSQMCAFFVFISIILTWLLF